MKENHLADIQKYIDVCDSLGDAVTIIDRDFKVVYQNQININMIGLHTGEHCYQAFEKKNDICEGCPVAQTFADGGRHNTERLGQLEEGHMHVESTSSPIRDSGGNIVACIEIVRDITAQKHAKEELEKIYDLSPDMLCVAGPDGYFKKVNNTWENVLGYSKEELLSKPFIEFVHPDDRKDTIEQLDKLISGKELFYFENRYGCKDGTYKILAWNAKPVEDGKIYAAARDITKRKKIEGELRKSEGRFRQFIKNTSQGVSMMDKSARITFVNKSMCEMFGYSEEELLGKTPSDFLEGENLAIFQQYLAERGKTEANPFEITFAKKDGTPLHTLLAPQIIKDREGSISGSFALISDITEQKKMEEERLKTQKLESIGVLAGGIAHDFNNILAAIMGNINLALFDQELKDKTKKLLSKAEKAALRATGITQQLLTFAKGGEPIKEIAHLGSVIKDAADFVLHGKNIVCDYHLPKDLWAVEIDRGQISQVIQNIVLNASHAMPAGGTISISGENIESGIENVLPSGENAKFVKISINDSGMGMPEKVLARIFEPYYTTKQEGSGLGLAVTQSIIRKHKGRIMAESSPGHGTTFTIYLPAADKFELPTEKSLEEKQISRQAKILVMDDEEMVRSIAEEMLSELGHQVDLAADGDEAIRLYRASMEAGRPYDLVIMDLTIPGGLGGKEAAVKTLAIDPKAKIIVTSGYSNDAIMANFEDYGFCSAIEKPFRLQELSKTIARIIN